MKASTVTIAGLDRISGSMGLAIRGAGMGLTVLGHDRESGLTTLAKELGAIDEARANLLEAVAAADIVILNLPMAELKETLQAVGSRVKPHTLVVDLSALKSAGLRWARDFLKQGHYVGVNPVLAAAVMADGRPGIDAANADLFRNSVFCIMPAPEADPKAVETAVNLGKILGATPFFLDPGEYDALMHGVETVPGLLAAAMLRAVMQAPGWRDMLRFAGLPFAQITAPLANGDLDSLAAADRLATMRWLDAVIQELQLIRHVVEEGDEERVVSVLEDLRAQHRRWLRSRQENDWEETTDVPDVSPLNLSGRLLGGFLRRGKDDKSKP
jgi:prephenate dehydrogenase